MGASLDEKGTFPRVLCAREGSCQMGTRAVLRRIEVTSMKTGCHQSCFSQSLPRSTERRIKQQLLHGAVQADIAVTWCHRMRQKKNQINHKVDTEGKTDREMKNKNKDNHGLAASLTKEPQFPPSICSNEDSLYPLQRLVQREKKGQYRYTGLVIRECCLVYAVNHRNIFLLLR